MNLSENEYTCIVTTYPSNIYSTNTVNQLSHDHDMWVFH